MDARDIPPTVARADPAYAYRDLLERAASDAAFFWHLRSLAVDKSRHAAADLATLERRLDARLNLLLSSSELGWSICESALAAPEAGDIFVAAVVALRGNDMARIRTAVQLGLGSSGTAKGLISAFGWLPADIAQPWTARLLHGKDMNHKYLGVAACSVRRDDPGELLSDILNREDCRAHAPLYERALRLVGELHRQELLPVLHGAMGARESSSIFWAIWSAVLLGQRALAEDLRPFVLGPGPYRARAIQLAFRVLPAERGREWISALARDPAQARAAIAAAGVLGDPQAVRWLIDKMSDAATARLAGDAFAAITAIDLEEHRLIQSPPGDEVDDVDAGIDEDRDLPWPDAEKVAAWWRHQGHRFAAGRRYLLGRPLSPEWLRHLLKDGAQRGRYAAALELALTEPGARLVNTRARTIA